jgi:hypothetical protein
LVDGLHPTAWQMEVALDRGDLYLRADKPGDRSVVTSRRS